MTWLNRSHIISVYKLEQLTIVYNLYIVPWNLCDRYLIQLSTSVTKARPRPRPTPLFHYGPSKSVDINLNLILSRVLTSAKIDVLENRMMCQLRRVYSSALVGWSPVLSLNYRTYRSIIRIHSSSNDNRKATRGIRRVVRHIWYVGAGEPRKSAFPYG